MKLTLLLAITKSFATAAVAMGGQMPPGAEPTPCAQGFVWRGAFPNDYVCVTPAIRAQAAEDNRQASARRDPGGPYGPNTCLTGYVWRAARPSDLVCVTPDVRDQTASDNAQAAARVARNPAVGPVRGAPTAVVIASAYKLSEWSTWGRSKGIEYRYRWGWNPQEPRYATSVDAIFELRNPQGRPWYGEARTRCENNTFGSSKSVDLRPNQTQEVKFLTLNCGTKANPTFKPVIVESAQF
jgi:hypothetical protein